MRKPLDITRRGFLELVLGSTAAAAVAVTAGVAVGAAKEIAGPAIRYVDGIINAVSFSWRHDGFYCESMIAVAGDELRRGDAVVLAGTDAHTGLVRVRRAILPGDDEKVAGLVLGSTPDPGCVEVQTRGPLSKP